MDLDHRAELGRHPIAEAAIDAQIEAFGLHRGSDTAERQLIAVALHRRDGFAVDVQRDEADCLWHAQRLRAFTPANPRTHLVVSGSEPQRGSSVIDNRRGLAVNGDLLRPVFRVARQRDP